MALADLFKEIGSKFTLAILKMGKNMERELILNKVTQQRAIIKMIVYYKKLKILKILMKILLKNSCKK